MTQNENDSSSSAKAGSSVLDSGLTSMTVGRKPRLLDLCCSAGGATRGYQMAGWEVVGVDVEAQPNYVGDEFYQADACWFLDNMVVGSFDAIHASPPCQFWSVMSKCRPGLAEGYPTLIAPLRERMEASGLPWVIENVPGSPLADRADLFGNHGIRLCGRMFGLMLYRHRVFETSFPIRELEHLPHLIPASKAGHWRPNTVISVSGNCSPISEARRAMGIDWMTRDELAEAIPPRYTQYVGSVLRRSLRAAA